MSLIRRIVTGAIAGAAGTLAMDLLWYSRYRRGGGDQPFTEWEFSGSTSSFEEASAPGEVGKMAADAVGVELPDELAGTTTDVVHWLTGVGYGVGHGLLQEDRGAVSGGVLTGLGAFSNSYATLGALGVYDPIWEHDPDTLRDDLSAHLVFGLAAGATYRLLTAGRHDDGR